MAVLVNQETRVLTQGITGATGQFHTRACKEYGTQMVAGITPGKGGSSFDAIPIFDTVGRAVAETGANATVIYVPPPFAADAIMEAADAGLPLIICITEGIPVRDMVRVKEYLAAKSSRLLGPNCPGVITPEEIKIRFDAWFYLATAPPGVEARVDGHEVVEARWYEPANALEAAQAGEIMLVFPTIKHLAQLANFRSATELIEYARRQHIQPVLPRVLVSGEMARIVLPDEPGYER